MACCKKKESVELLVCCAACGWNTNVLPSYNDQSY